MFLIGGIFCNWGQMGANGLVEFEIYFDWGHFFKLGAKVLVEFEKMCLIRGHFLILGIFFIIGGKWGQMC